MENSSYFRILIVCVQKVHINSSIGILYGHVYSLIVMKWLEIPTKMGILQPTKAACVCGRWHLHCARCERHIWGLIHGGNTRQCQLACYMYFFKSDIYIKYIVHMHVIQQNNKINKI